MKTLPLFADLDYDPMSSQPDGHARETAWLDGVVEWLTNEADSGEKSLAFLPSSVPVGFLEKTSPVFCRSVAAGFALQSEFYDHATQFSEAEDNADVLNAMTAEEFKQLTREAISSVCWPTWQNWGMGSPTAFLTLSGSESPSAADVCSLSDILETGDVPQKYYLSAKACHGILRRAEKRGRVLPTRLREALIQVAVAEADTQEDDRKTTTA